MKPNPAEAFLPSSALSATLVHQRRMDCETVPLGGLLVETLDAFACAVIIVDRARRIMHANAAAEMLLREGNLMRRQDQKLTAGPRSGLPLADAIASVLAPSSYCTRGAAGFERQDRRSVVLSIGRTQSGTCPPSVIAHVNAIGPPVDEAGGSAAARAAVTVPAYRLLRAEDGEAFALAYGLTVMEVRVLVALANGLPSKAAAAQLGIGTTTLITHLKHIFDKTGVRRQTTILAMFLRSLSPLRL